MCLSSLGPVNAFVLALSGRLAQLAEDVHQALRLPLGLVAVLLEHIAQQFAVRLARQLTEDVG